MSEQKYKVINEGGDILIKQFNSIRDRRHRFVSLKEAECAWEEDAYILTKEAIENIDKEYMNKAVPVGD